MGKAVVATEDNFDELLKNNKVVLVDFWAQWCGPCLMMAPIVDELATEYDGKAAICKVDVDSNPGLSMRFGIRSIPTMLLFLNGELHDKTVGAVQKKTLNTKLDGVI